eukprot:1250720-Rhodomonas_salina.3
MRVSRSDVAAAGERVCHCCCRRLGCHNKHTVRRDLSCTHGSPRRPCSSTSLKPRTLPTSLLSFLPRNSGPRYRKVLSSGIRWEDAKRNVWAAVTHEHAHIPVATSYQKRMGLECGQHQRQTHLPSSAPRHGLGAPVGGCNKHRREACE